LGIDGLPEETQNLQPGMIGYHPTPARVIFALIEHTHLSAADVFYDLGAGLGRVVLLVGLLTTAHVKGIEFEPAYCAYAQQRADSLHLSRVTFFNVDARQADYTDGTVFFLYTPFTGRMLQVVLAQLEAVAHTHPITLVTYGACRRDVAQQRWVQPTVQQAFAHDTLSLFRSR
jgi:SAM-dependent methyltransferase